MQIEKTNINGPLVISYDVFKDKRGFFYESFNINKLKNLGLNTNFVQDNVSCSQKGVLRGLHCQILPKAQAKMIIVLRGRIRDVIVDVRKNSPTFGEHFMIELSENCSKALYVPVGFVHGFLSLEDKTIVQYKCDEYYSPKYERGILYSDPEIGINWDYPEGEIIMNDRDRSFPALTESDLNFLYGG